MELEEVETINLRDVCLPFGCQWSEDDTLAISTENEVHILKLKPNMYTIENTFHFLRQTIKPRDEYPNQDLQQFVRDILYRETRFNVYNMINDVMLTPDGRNLDCFDITPRCAQYCWSPAGVVNNFQCALLFLSNTGFVDIQISQELFWVVVVDLTKLYVEQIKRNWIVDSSLNYDTLKLQTCQACTVCIDWSPMYGNHDCSFIVMGQLNGDILVWKMTNFLSSRLEYLPVLITVFNTNLSRLTTVHWVRLTDFSALVLVGDINGVVKGYEINNIFELQLTSEQSYWPYNDNIRTDKIFSENIGSNLLIFAIKRSNIIVFLISNTGQLLSTKVHRVGNLFITGFQQITSKHYALSTHTSSIVELNILIKQTEIINIESNEIKNPINRQYLSCAGICTSKTRALWILCTNYCKPINHLIIREPLQVIICSNNYFNAENLLLENPNQKLIGYWDCLELFRISSDKNEAKTDLVEHQDNYDNVSLYRLKIYYWIATLTERMIKKKKRTVNIKFDLLSSSKEYLVLIKVKHAIARLKKLIELFTKQKFLKDFDLHSVRYLREYLMETRQLEAYKNLLGKNTETDVNQVLEQSQNIQLLDPIKCSFCDADIFNESCTNDHYSIENRCIISFIPFSSVFYPTCLSCNYPSHPELEEIPMCIVCDSIMMFQDYKYTHNT